MKDDDKASRRRTAEKRMLDQKLTNSLRKIYDPMLDEPVPEQLLEILRRAAGDKTSS